MAAVAAAFAGKAVATSAISYIISKAFDHLKENKKADGLKSTRERLERLVPQIQAVFDAVDAEQIKDQSEALDAWLWQLRDAVEEAEDALDELEYNRLEGEVKLRDNKVSGSLHKFKGKVVRQFNHTFDTGSLKRLRSAVKTLEDVAAGVERFLHHVLNQLDTARMKVDFRNSRETSSLPQIMVIGREQERKAIVDWLIKSENRAHEQSVNNIPVFSIVGIGGLGKTTLAQVICNDNEVKDCFDLVIWVCVSQGFNVETLTRKILQDLTGEETNMVGLNALHKALKEKLSSKTFLLVLDDVWNDESVEDWEYLARPLRYGKRGSKILLTTRMESVADLAARAMQGGCQSLRLSGLEETDLLVLLNRHAFSGVNPDDYRNLQQISKKIAIKLSGSPLAAKVLGGLLNSNMDCRTWNRLTLDIFNIEQGKEGIMKVLRLSYQHLPTHLQACFRYCSLFEKNYKFTKKELVYLWMGSGLIQHSVNNMVPEDVGMEYLNTLTKKSFFDIISRPRSSRAIKYNLFDEFYEERYIIHDLLNDFARAVSVKECTRVDRNFSEMIPVTVRHMSVKIINPTLVEQISQAKRLCTLILHFQEQDQVAQELILDKVFAVSKSLRVLLLTTNSACKLPDKFGRLVHLRYLALIWGRKIMTHFAWFPQSVYNLYHLQIMKFDDPQLRIPVKGEIEKFCNLVSLRHLQLSYGILPIIPYVGKLTSLHELCGFCIQQLSGYTIGELKNLKNICHLYISDLDKVKDTEEAAEIMLNQKDNVSAMILSWSPGSSDSCDPSKAAQLLHELEPHPNSCKLKIQGYPGSLSPRWLQCGNLINLTYLYLCDFQRLQRLPPIGQLPSLQYLYIINMKSVDRVDSSFYGSEKPYGLQCLKVLEIQDMPTCTEWVGMEGENLFPRLETLVVRNCEQLRNLPDFPVCIRHVEIHRLGLQTMPPIFVSSSTSQSSMLDLCISKLMIFHCPNMATLWQGCSLSALEELSIEQCVSLSCLQQDLFGSFSTLKTITLGLCADAETPVLNSLQDLKNLKRIFLDVCAFLSFPQMAFSGLVGLTDMVFLSCAMNSLPSAEAFAGMTNLENLAIWYCKELVSLNGIQGLSSLSSLSISCCNSLVEDISAQSVESAHISECALKLGELDIDHPSVLLKDPLQTITTVKILRISGGPELALLPEDWLLRNCEALEEIIVSNASHLTCLPQEMASLISLRSLHISHANMLQALPNMPASLKNLRIENCHSELKKRCERNVGLDWDKIAHVDDVDIC